MINDEDFIISSSNILALWQLIILTNRHDTISVGTAVEIVLSYGTMGGGLPAKQGLTLGRRCKLLSINEQNLFSTQLCKEEIHPLCDTEEPNVEVIRRIISIYMSLKNYDWLLFYNDDPIVFKTFIPKDWVELFESVGLFEFNDLQVCNWWSNIFSRFQKYKEGKKIEIGKLGEKLTFEFEKKRLLENDFTNVDFYVKWASLINDKFGYDILSIRGKLMSFDQNEKDKIRIEVKSSQLLSTSSFRFFISKNEWLVALENINDYFIYCWVGADINKQSAEGPYIIPITLLLDQIPIDRSEICQWSECRVLIDINKESIKVIT